LKSQQKILCKMRALRWPGHIESAMKNLRDSRLNPVALQSAFDQEISIGRR
jgi:hypothetical protein